MSLNSLGLMDVHEQRLHFGGGQSAAMDSISWADVLCRRDRVRGGLWATVRLFERCCGSWLELLSPW